ncbi:transcriptional regulator, TetR family [Promicromonospora umidemergens]|uniref:TetR/AcrR family transcriptional regulator n=1 Tax=Promicromonospora umidemergens TaxID=629679 RepID=A0ABP8Y5L8_9MICO|nr:TetR/AcrR family transcriptional regulator [Promicromonospora umidemergens]MCP2282738.1 transcriptional regulator, TetR family [Promicromonospora umidemergens]
MSGQTNTERGRDVRARLLQAARELISEVGWGGVSTRVLAERAGVRYGLVHYHFESLQALLRQATLEAMSGMLDGTAALLTGAANPADGVEAMLLEHDQYDGTDPASLLFIEGYLAATRDTELRDQMSAIMIRFRTTLATSLADAGHPSADEAASVIMAAFDGFILHKGLDPELSGPRIAPILRTLAGTGTTEPNGAQR